MLTEIHLDDASPTCRVIRGASRQMYITTPVAVGMALVSGAISSGVDDEAAVGAAITWTDMLATHGVAVGRRGTQDLTVALIPPKLRTVRWRASETYEDITTTFPAMLIAMATQQRRFLRATMFLADLTKQARMATNSEIPCLVAFPYGNVYSESGLICWGGVEHGDILSIADLETAFFNSGFNTDLWYMGSTRTLKTLATATPAGTPLPVPTGEWHGTIMNAIGRLARG